MTRANDPSVSERNRRQRTAPIARATSDVTRYRGLLWASAFGTLLLVTGLVWTGGPSAVLSPGALNQGHSQAALDCQSCHHTAQPTDSCGSCHVGQRSRRTAHRQLQQSGQLRCNHCHPGHATSRTLVFERDGLATLWHAGGEVPLKSSSAFRPEATARLPLVAQRSCASCHDPSNPRDPAGACFTAVDEEFQRCFDEHRAAADAPSDRDALWEASRKVLNAGALPERQATPDWWLLALSLCGATLVFTGSQWWRRRRALGAPTLAAQRAAARVRLPQIDTTTCLGCYACVDACPFDVLEVRRFVAVVARPDACCGLSLCEQRCPNGSLVVREGEPINDRPRLDQDLQSLDVPGLYLAGDLSGLSLIRNAINQGAHVAHHLAARASEKPAPAEQDIWDLLVVGSGPAGLSATLEASRLGLRVLALEQGALAESIKSFPRHKLVLDHGVAADARASLWVEQCQKEELVAKWTQTARREQLPIRERHRVTGLTRENALFRVKVETPDGESLLLARHVLLAMGKRGSPRQLQVPTPEAWLSHVHYSLLDARPFQGRKVLVVGLGDTAMEAAVALAGQPESEVTLVARGAGFSRGKSKNIQALQHLANNGKVELLFESRVTAFRADGVDVSVAGAVRRLSVDSVFVLIGAELPWGLLESAGIRRTGKIRDVTQESR